MRAIPRQPLPEATRDYLDAPKRRVDLRKPRREQAEEADRLWENFGSRRLVHRDNVEATLRDMNGGSGRCMYCEDDRARQIDHFTPVQLRPELVLTWENLNWSCGPCNNRKRERFSVHLLNPTAPGFDPDRHFTFNKHNGRWCPCSASGVVSADIYGLDDPDLCNARRAAFITFQVLIRAYRDERDAGSAHARLYANAMKETKVLRSVFTLILRLHRSGNPGGMLEPATVDALNRYGEDISSWL